jgi:hypothetical protein
MLRYTLLRTLVFFGCLLVGWLAGLRGQENLIPLVLVAAIASMVISYFALRRFREDYSRQIADKLQERAERKQHLHRDEAAEDAEDEGHPTYR